MKYLIVATFLYLLPMSLFAKSLPLGQTVCLAQHPEYCAELRPISEIKRRVEGEFLLFFQIPKTIKYDQLKMALKMPEMDHPNAPVEILKQTAESYLVRNVWFTMTGKWVLEVGVRIQGKVHQFVFPFEIIE